MVISPMISTRAGIPFPYVCMNIIFKLETNNVKWKYYYVCFLLTGTEEETYWQ